VFAPGLDRRLQAVDLGVGSASPRPVEIFFAISPQGLLQIFWASWALLIKNAACRTFALGVAAKFSGCSRNHRRRQIAPGQRFCVRQGAYLDWPHGKLPRSCLAWAASVRGISPRLRAMIAVDLSLIVYYCIPNF
jgi:hypothetical protein